MNKEIENFHENSLYCVAQSKIGKDAPPNTIELMKLLISDFKQAYEIYQKIKKGDINATIS